VDFEYSFKVKTANSLTFEANVKFKNCRFKITYNRGASVGSKSSGWELTMCFEAMLNDNPINLVTLLQWLLGSIEQPFKLESRWLDADICSEEVETSNKSAACFKSHQLKFADGPDQAGIIGRKRTSFMLLEGDIPIVSSKPKNRLKDSSTPPAIATKTPGTQPSGSPAAPPDAATGKVSTPATSNPETVEMKPYNKKNELCFDIEYRTRLQVYREDPNHQLQRNSRARSARGKPIWIWAEL